MRSGTEVYRVLVRLYPRQFRREFADDLVQMFADLAERDGSAAAWRRTVVDLGVTVPRYRLETILSARRSSTVIWLSAIVGAIAGVALLAADVASTAALALVVVAAVVVLAQRSQLARSLRPDTASDRRRLWVQSVVAAAIAVGAIVIGFADRTPDRRPRDRVTSRATRCSVALAVRRRTHGRAFDHGLPYPFRLPA